MSERIYDMKKQSCYYLLITFTFYSASGHVYTACDKVTGQVVAVKKMAFKSQPKKELLLTEIKVMQKYKHEVRKIFAVRNCCFATEKTTVCRF